jgi:hypothetical protein
MAGKSDPIEGLITARVTQEQQLDRMRSVHPRLIGPVYTGRSNPGLVSPARPVIARFLPPSTPASRRLVLRDVPQDARISPLRRGNVSSACVARSASTPCEHRRPDAGRGAGAPDAAASSRGDHGGDSVLLVAAGAGPLTGAWCRRLRIDIEPAGAVKYVTQ